MSEATRRAAVGAGWLYAYRWGERLIDLVSIIVLARLLTPDAFGLVAIAASVAAIIEGLSDFDVAKALIRSSDDDRDLYDTAWTLSVLRGTFSAAIMLAIASWLEDPEIAAILCALAATPWLKGLSNPRFVVFERALVYSRLAALTLGAKLVAFGTTLFLAWRRPDHWALVIGMIAGASASLVLTYALRPYRPRVSLGRCSEIFAFSGWMSLTTMVTTLAMETDKIIVGRLLGVTEAGLYFMTQRVGVLPTRELVSPLQRLLYPSFSEIVHDPFRLRRVVLESINVLGSLSLPAGCGFALVAAELVPLTLGATWNPIVPLLMILVPFLGLRGTLSMTLPCVMALGRTRLLFGVSAGYALVHIPAFVAGTWWFGLRGAVASIVAAGLLYTALNAWMLRATLGISVGEISAQLWRPAAATTAMVAVVLTVDATVPAASNAWLAVARDVTIGAVTFGGVLYALWRLAGRPAGFERRIVQVLAS